jgi:NAD(P)-dependent dehydrogenase (short-subunit alcohol dehydrogenase family)
VPERERGYTAIPTVVRTYTSVVDLGLAGKTAIVTGGSRGIGKAVARELSREGVSVAVVARDYATLKATAREIEGETGGRMIPIAADTGSDEAVRAMVAAAARELGGIDILVNCAARAGGQAPPPRLSEIDDQVIWPDLNVKVLGYLRCMREVAPHMAARGGGRIVSVSGLAARSTGSTIGSVRNAAVAALTKNVADELAAQKITAVVVHPGQTRTEATPAVIRAAAASGGISEAEAEKRMGGRNLLARVIDASEVAAVIVFLCSPRAQIINGDAIAVAGGIRGSIFY